MKRRHGEGWIEKQRGRFRARYWVDGKKVTIGTFDTHEEADGAITVFAEGLAKDSPVAGETLASWSRKWLDHRETDGVHRSVTRDRHAFKRVTRAEIAQLPLAAITPRDVRDWVAVQVKTGAAKQTIQNALNLLRVCLEHACHTGLIERNPAHGIKTPRIARTKDSWTWLKEHEIDALLAGDSEERDVYAVAIYTGARAGELFGLEWRDVDLRAGVAAIRHSWKGSPTKRGEVRRVALLAPAVEALRRQLARRRQEGESAHELAARMARKAVFPARDGEHRGKDQMPDLAAALKRVGIARHVRFHDLRHSCASHLIQGTWAPEWVARALSLAEVSEWLGHTSPTTTARYAHLCPDAVQGLVVRAPLASPLNAPRKVVSIADGKGRKHAKTP